MAALGFAERGLVFRPFEPEVYFTTYLRFRPDAQKAQLVTQFVAELMKARSISLPSSPPAP